MPATRPAPAQAPAAAVVEEPRDPVGAQALRRLLDAWDQVLGACIAERPDLAAALTACRPIQLDEADLVLEGVGLPLDPQEFGPEGCARRLIERHAGTLLGRNLVATARAGTGASALAAAPGSRQEAYEQAARHPLVEALMRHLDAEIIAREPIRRS